jgi:hypothetical protein
MKKKEWGNAVWYLFHTLAEKLKPECHSEVSVLFSHIITICNNLPCPDCQNHAKQAMQRANKSVITSSRENLINFLWMFHNSVNKRTKAPEYSKESLDMYKRSNTRNVIQNFISVMSENSRNERAMLNTFHRQRFIKAFIEYINVNIGKYNI